MTLVRWNPWREMEHVFNANVLDRLENAGSEQMSTADWRPSVDIHETADAYTIALDVPAIAPKEIHVAVKERVLTVSGERKQETSSDDAKVHRVERRVGRFERSFVLPENANPDAIDAAAKDGVLTLKVSKRVVNQAKPIEVRVH